MKKARAHTKYFLEDGTQVVGTTTITGILAKYPLYNWYWKLGRDGVDHRKHLDFLANVGTLAHSMIFHLLKDEEADTSDYSQNQIELARNSFESFLRWEEQHELESILMEEPLVSEKYKYGGTPDFYGLVDGIETLLDFKSSGIYPDQFIQLSAYKNLLEEREMEVKRCWVLVIPTDKGGDFKEAQKEDVSKHWEIFLHCLPIYNLQKEIKR